jgi:hypothetical protein
LLGGAAFAGASPFAVAELPALAGGPEVTWLDTGGAVGCVLALLWLRACALPSD